MAPKMDGRAIILAASGAGYTPANSTTSFSNTTGDLEFFKNHRIDFLEVPRGI